MSSLGSSERFEAKSARRRERLLQEVAEYHNPDNVPTHRAEHFARALGLPIPGCVILPNLKKGSVFERPFARAGEKLTLDRAGFYSKKLGLAAVNADTKYVERTLAHEIAHHRRERQGGRRLADALTGKFTQKGFPGFINAFGGGLIEEIYATLAEGSFGYVVSRVSGRVSLGETVPRKYEDVADHYAYGAVGWEMLCHKNPNIIEPMLASRTDRTAITDVIGEVNMIRPGLYEGLHAIARQKVHIGRSDSTNFPELIAAFKTGMDQMLGAVSMSWGEAVELSASGQSAFDRYAAEKCAAYKLQNPGAFAVGNLASEC